MGGFEHGKATGLYVIIEQIYPKQGLPSIANTFGPNLIQVVRQVFQLHVCFSMCLLVWLIFSVARR